VLALANPSESLRNNRLKIPLGSGGGSYTNNGRANFGFEIQNSQQNLGTVLGNNNSWSGMGKNQNNLNNWKHIVVSYDGNITFCFNPEEYYNQTYNQNK
jgi:hypothetical protein